jgi:GT2 family glycosyltransferase
VFLLVFVTALIIRKVIVEDEKRIHKKNPDVMVVINDDNYGFTGRLP